ncbi:hypothetical protein [Endozoicomonas sp. 8E]|uniref:hypothetical protein n=1 Tax=Endozoicomonas sp. 8E TaxID=3035692 RepID=UPI00293916FD|nr:hypothetical protein [Endozoicomonas sp. 8E]WOG27683.1 hypothetical protein P6910_24570 [Endozoicomonas sp. 8E]
MDSLPSKTVGGTTEQLSFAGSIPSSDNSGNTGVAFATRKVSGRDEVMLPGAASEKWDQAIKIDCQAGHKRNVTVADITSKISGTSLAALTSEPVEKCPKIGKTETEPAHWPVIDPSLIESTQVAKTALLQPYHPSHISPSAQTIAREVHGVQHSCRTAIWAVALLELRKQHGDPLARAFPDQMIPLLIKTCLFHDTGREGDGNDTPEWERASADNLREHLRNFGVDQSLAWQCGEAICHKDNPKGCEQLPEVIQTLRSLLHDADTLDVMRVRGRFYMDRLECFAACQDDLQKQEWRLLAEEVCQVIARQGDLWCPIKLQDSEANCKHFFSIGAATRCENTKKQWEHHPSPFSYQLFSIGEQSAVVRELITPYTGELKEPQESSFSLAKLTPQAAAMEECQSRWPAGLYNDPVSQQVYSVKPASCELSARNQLLMANLAGLLGITVPQSFVHEEQGHFYVVSPVPEQWQGKLKGGEATLCSLSPEQWARLLLINVIVGNENMVNSAWEGIELTPEGEPVMFHWDYAGMATRYPCPEKPEPASKTDDFSSMPLLLNKLRNPQAPPMNSLPIDNPCVDILAQLEDDLLGHTLKDILRQVDWQGLNQLIEHSGFLPGDRSWLRQTIHDRIAWLTTRFPNSLEAGERVSMAEYKAIEAAGIRGGWLPVKGRDVRGGQIGISQLLDANGQPITRMTLKLSREAGNKLADNLALDRGLHRLACRVKYTNFALNNPKHAPNDHYRDWRSDLISLANNCESMAGQLAKDKSRWHAKNHNTIDQTVMVLQDIANKCRASLTNDLPFIAKLPAIKTPLPAPALPARVSSRTGEEVEVKIQLAEFSHGFAKLTGQSVGYLSTEQLDAARLSASPVRAVELESTVCEGGSILFSPPSLPEALSFENQLTLTFPGHSKAVVEALFRELAELGIGGERPDINDLEEQWLDALADYHGCLGDMNLAVAADINTPVNTDKKAFLKELLNFSDEELLNWEIHCRIRAGRLVHYRPGLPHGISADPARQFCLGHTLGFCSHGERNNGQVLISLENEAVLSSFERRHQIGMKPHDFNAGNIARRIKSNTEYTFTRVMEQLADNSRYRPGGAMSLRLTSETLGRMDAKIYKEPIQYSGGFPGLEALARNEKIITRSTHDYQSVIKHTLAQETCFSKPVSLLDEWSKLEMSSLEGQRQLLDTLKKRFSHWPDGRPLEQLFRESWSVLYRELTSQGSKHHPGLKGIVSSCGEERIQLLFEQNPQLLEGKLDSLDGFELKSLSTIESIDFSGCSMKGTILPSITFQQCKFNTERLNSAIVDSCFFSQCSFEGERFSSSVLDNVRFHTPGGKDGEVLESTRQISQILYQSCVNENNEFNLKKWLEVMGESDYLCYFSTPLDDLSRDILSQHIDEIIRTYPQQLHKIIYGLFFIEFKSTANAINFIRNNPEFYHSQIKDLKDVYFEFRTTFLKEGDYNWSIGHPFENLCPLYRLKENDFTREAVLALMLNVMNLVLFPESNDKYIDFGVNANSTDEHDDCLKVIPEVSSESTQNNSISSLQTDDLPLAKMQAYKADLCKYYLEEYREYFHQFWKECTEKSQIRIAKHCLLHQNIAVSPLTTIEFLNSLPEGHDEQYWLKIKRANMSKHTKNQDEWDRLL